MRSEPARLGEISLDFAEIPPRRDEKFSMWALASVPARQDVIEFSLSSFVLFLNIN